MNIYLVESPRKDTDEHYDSVVVIAKNEDAARNIYPSEFHKAKVIPKDGKWTFVTDNGKLEHAYESTEWVSYKHIHLLKVTLVGKALKGSVEGVVLASYISPL